MKDDRCPILSDFYYKYCSIKSTGLVNCTGFLLRVLVLSRIKALTAKCTVSIKSTGMINCTGFLLIVLIFYQLYCFLLLILSFINRTGLMKHLPRKCTMFLYSYPKTTA